MGSLGRKMQRANARRPKSVSVPRPPQQQHEYIHEGIFSDCHGTLYGHSFGRNDLLVKYLNAKFEDGIKVTLISTEPHKVREIISDIGLHPDILMTLRDKRGYYNECLEEWIDDDPIPIIDAVKTWHPTNDPAFKKHMENYLASRQAQPSAPTP